MANTILQGPPSSSYIKEVVSCPTCHGLDAAKKRPETIPVRVPYGWGGEYWLWTKTTEELSTSDTRGCQICGVLCDLLVEVKKHDNRGNITLSNTIDFLLPLSRQGFFNVKFLSWSRRKDGKVEESDHIFQVGTSSSCKLL